MTLDTSYSNAVVKGAKFNQLQGQFTAVAF